MEKISDEELMEILAFYGVKRVSYVTSKQVTSDSMVYVFADEEGASYVLYAADYLGGYEDLDMPHDFEFDEGYPYSKVSFRAFNARKLVGGGLGEIFQELRTHLIE